MLEIERIRKSGNKFVILTNRSAEELTFCNRDFPFIDYIIAFNGNYVLDVENNKCLLDTKLREEDIELIKETYRKCLRGESQFLPYEIDHTDKGEED